MEDTLIIVYYLGIGFVHIILWALLCRLTEKKEWPKIKNDSAAMGVLLIITLWPLIDIIMLFSYLLEDKRHD